MKTNQVMIRPMGQFEVQQRTKDGMFNATALILQWNKEKKANKNVSDFLELGKTEEFCLELIKEELNIELSKYGESPEKLIVSKLRKGKIKDIYTISRGVNGGTWMHPYLFIDFAMWINPKFKLQVIKFVYDHLISFRHKAGDNYRYLMGWLATLDRSDYQAVAKAMNFVVFNKHESGRLRQTANEHQLKELDELQMKLAYSIERGYVKTLDHLLDEMREIWKEKNSKGLYNAPRLDVQPLARGGAS